MGIIIIGVIILIPLLVVIALRKITGRDKGL